MTVEIPDLTVGTSDCWRSILRRTEQLARGRMPIVLLGPTGSGKTTVASLIHRMSGRRGAFVSSSIPAVPPELRHSILQGHVRGAFTGALADHLGLLEQAHLGTLFLDEIGLIPPPMQELLLTVLDGRGITRVGDVRPRQVDVHLVVATNSDPQVLVMKGTWRVDFYYRLGFAWIRLPALRDRAEDILPMAQAMLEQATRAGGELAVPRIGPEVKALFLRHPWPGNIRELRSVCEYAALLMAPGHPVQIEHLPQAFLDEAAPAGEREVYEAHARHIHDVLRRHAGNKSAAARELGLNRQDLYRFLERNPRHTPSGGYSQEA